MSAKSKSALSAETPNVSKTEVKPGADHSSSSSSSSLQSARDRSRASVTSNPTVKNPSRKAHAKNKKIKATRIVKRSGLEAELNLAQEELKKANEKFVLLGKEKAKAIKQVKEAKEKDYEAVKEIEIIKPEKSKLGDELEASRNEEEKSKKVSENLALALHEVSSQARDAKEALLSIQFENECYKIQLEGMKSDMEAKDEKYESVINALTISTERAKRDYRDMKAEMERKELYLTNTLKRAEEEKSCMEFEIKRLGNLVKKLEKEARGGTSEKEATKSVKTRERENELRKNVSENDDLRKEENGDSSEKDYDMLPKWTSFVQINGEEKEGEEEGEDFSEEDIEMWESLKVDEKDSYTESEANGVMMKKKKPLLAKIGRLLKKESAD